MVMKRWVWALLAAIFLCGCQTDEAMETVADEWLVPVMAQPREISVRLPEDMVMPVLQQDSRQLYMAEGYDLMLDILDAGDVSATVRDMSGYSKEDLTVIRTRQEGLERYDFVWSSAGENGDRLGRGVILDDGNYHYCMSVLRDQGNTDIVWQDVFGSFTVV